MIVIGLRNKPSKMQGNAERIHSLASDSAYLYFPLFFKNKTFGYIALAYENNRIDYQV